jgi:hypothetical protein
MRTSENFRWNDTIVRAAAISHKEDIGLQIAYVAQRGANSPQHIAKFRGSTGGNKMNRL